MLAIVSLFLLGTAFAATDAVPDCSNNGAYREELFTSIRGVNPSLEWTCDLEKKAKNGEKPPSAYEVTVSSFMSKKLIPSYIKGYGWKNHRDVIGDAKKFGCHVGETSGVNKGLKEIKDLSAIQIICYFSN